MSDKEYTISLSGAQLDLIKDALETHVRLGIGQLEFLLEHESILPIVDSTNHPGAFTLLSALKKMLFGLPSYANHSILNDKLSDKLRAGFDLMRVIRHQRAWDLAGNPSERTKEMFGVHYDSPSQMSQWELAVVKKN